MRQREYSFPIDSHFSSILRNSTFDFISGDSIFYLNRFNLIVSPCKLKQKLVCISSELGASNIPLDSVALKIHVYSDPRYLKVFFQLVLPFFELRWKETGAGIVLMTGLTDYSVSDGNAKIILQSSSILRWILENNNLEYLNDNQKAVHVPIGINYKYMSSSLKEHLGMIINEKNLRSEFHTRKDRILFCFSGKYGFRPTWHEWAVKNCTVCDICNSTHERINETDYWNLIKDYKFVFSPWGRGYDCHRTYEILLLGGIPVIPYFPGVNGIYKRNNISVISITNPVEINELNMSIWKRQYTHSHDLNLFKLEYWDKLFFANLPVIPRDEAELEVFMKKRAEAGLPGKKRQLAVRRMSFVSTRLSSLCNNTSHLPFFDNNGYGHSCILLFLFVIIFSIIYHSRIKCIDPKILRTF